MIARRNFLLSLSALFGVVFTPTVLRSASKKDKAEAAKPGETNNAKDAGVSQFRLWKATDAAQQPISLRFLVPGKSDSAALTPVKIDEQEYQFSPYVEVPSGPMIVEVAVSGQPPVRLPRYFAANGLLTLLARFQNGKLSAEWLDDTLGVPSSGCVFRIYNLLPDSGDIEVNVGSILTVHLPSVRSSVRMSEIKPALYPIAIKGKGKGGREFSSNLDLDFTQCHKATLIICPDAYDRIRPRINTI